MWDAHRQSPARLTRAGSCASPPLRLGLLSLQRPKTRTQLSHGQVATLRVVAVGPLATIQDPGRPGHGAIGVPGRRRGPRRPHHGQPPRGQPRRRRRSGGPPRRPGPAHRREPVVVALAGAPVPVRVDGRAVDPAGPIALSAGAEFVVDRALHGLRSYLAVRGGIVTERTLGSASSSHERARAAAPGRRGPPSRGRRPRGREPIGLGGRRPGLPLGIHHRPAGRPRAARRLVHRRCPWKPCGIRSGR